MKILLPGLMSVALALTIASASANLVTNSGFETGDFTGWTSGGFTGVDMGSAHSGTYGAYIGTTEVASFVSQDLSTTAGSLYDLSFFLQGFETKSASQTNVLGGFESTFQVFWNGILVLNLVNPDPFQYTQFNFTGLAATGTTTNLRFVYSGGPLFYNLDDVTVNPATVNGVPESLSSLWLMLPTVGMFLASGQRRRTA